ncbi:MAG TPA: PfkB family carbohydrate kinase [Vicinamibacterales bacterium]
MFDVVGVGANSVDYVYVLPQFPHPDTTAAKLPVTRHVVSCGGQTATALCACAAMGLRTKYVGAIGNDGNGERIRRELERRGVNVDQAYIRDASNPFAVILLDERRRERVVLWNRDPALRLRADEIDASLVTSSRLLHVDDTDEDAAIRAASLARSAGIPVTSDIERVTERTEALVAAVTIPILAEHALEQLTGERDFERALRIARQQRVRQGVRLKPDTTYEHDMLCVTLGARGAMLLEGDRLHHVPGLAVDVVDTTGAGDVFRGAFITALLRGDSPADILRFANAAAAISCTRLGAINGVPTVEEVGALLR